MSGLSIASLAASPSSPLRSRAQKLTIAIPELFVDDADRLLTGDISPVAHELSDKLEELKAASAAAGSRHEVRKIEDALLLVMELRFAVATERKEPPTLPYYQDIMTVDMNDYSIKNTVTEDLHLLGLGPATFGELTTAVPIFPLRGALWGYNLRPFFTFVVERGTTRAQVPVFVDTRGHETYLNRTTLSLFLPPNTDYSAWMPNHSIEMNIHGISVPVKLGNGRTLGCNMVGKHWLDKASVVFIADYAKQGCCMHKSVAVRDLMQQLQLPIVVE